jgi:hypothetical protein
MRGHARLSACLLPYTSTVVLVKYVIMASYSETLGANVLYT